MDYQKDDEKEELDVESYLKGVRQGMKITSEYFETEYGLAEKEKEKNNNAIT